MNITFRKNNDVPYEDLDIGDVFVHVGRVYMVVKDLPEEDAFGALKSVDLANGEMEIFGAKTMVNRIDNAELILK